MTTLRPLKQPTAGGVLIRALEPLEGIALMLQNCGKIGRSIRIGIIKDTHRLPAVLCARESVCKWNDGVEKLKGDIRSILMAVD